MVCASFAAIKRMISMVFSKVYGFIFTR